jgi:type II secretory ATPase GspE/PulE/Tfp pilus assembly ATPase PilB-like protein
MNDRFPPANPADASSQAVEVQSQTAADQGRAAAGRQPPAIVEPSMTRQAFHEELETLVGRVGLSTLVDVMLQRAFDLRATDVHLDPCAEGLWVRLRMDGLLHDIVRFPPAVTPTAVSRLKLLARMDLTEKRQVQDGHFTTFVNGQERHVRVGSSPTIDGERIVLRLMPEPDMFFRLEDLGLDAMEAQQLRRCIGRNAGLTLSVGPVGSGKTTTMYSCLELLKDPTKSVVTLEDPVERRIDRVNQIQIDPRIDFSFASALRGVLRQDPNIIMIGEIRDTETAQIACRAGLTGIAVLSTLHADDTASAVDMFRAFEIPPTFIAGSLQGLIAQRLMRRLCLHCRAPHEPDPAELEYLKLPSGAGAGAESHHEINAEAVATHGMASGSEEGPQAGRDGGPLTLYQPVGCEACFGTGYSGRTGIFEIMAITPDTREALVKQKPQSAIRQIAATHGTRSLEESAKARVLQGITGLDELHRVFATLPN